jgi:5-methylcytosine-specific restriction endonuclease McrA
MTLSETLWEQVRRRANECCEYCGVTETDSAGRLTVDHFQPRAQGGPDELDNLLYCCWRCNSRPV